QLWSHPAGTVRRQLPYTTSQQRSTLQPRALSVITGTDDGGRSGPAHVFKTPYTIEVFCDRVFRDAVDAAGIETETDADGLWFIDASDA
ncbi:hypothetical protein QYG38_23035, partial [Xanthomonas euvesicatoria]